MNGYLLFHTLAELFSVIIAWSILTVAWNARPYLKHGFFPWLGVWCAAVGALDLAHTLAYKGMGIFAGDTSNLATQLWIAARWVSALSWVLAPFWIARSIRFHWLVAASAAVTSGLLVAVFGGVFPDCFRPESGLTPFKIASEYAVCLLVTGAIALLWRARSEFEPAVLRLLLASMALTVATELAFTFYKDVYGVFNLTGHLLKIAAFTLLYRALIVSGLRRPFETLFRDARRSEERLSAAFHGSIAGMSISRLRDGMIIDVNAAWLPMFGYTREQVVLRSSATEVWKHPDEREKLMRDLQAHGVVEDRECQFRKASGEEFVGLLSGRVTELHGQSVMIASVIDITARKQAELALRESEQRFRTVGELNPFGVWECDPDGSIVYLSQSWLDMVGRTLDECRRSGGLGSDVPEVRETMLQAWHDCQETGQRWEYEHRVIDKDGQERWVLSRGFPLRDSDGRIVKWVGQNIDITARKDIENRLAASLRELRETQEALVRNERLAMLGKLAGSVAHIIRTPLSVMQNTAFFLEQTLVSRDEPTREAVEELKRAIANSDHVITEMLDFVREPSPVATDFAIGKAISTALRAVPIPAEIRSHLSDGGSEVHANPDQVTRILVNLVRNAVQAMPEGGELEIAANADGNRNVLVRVRDTGCGIPPEKLKEIFEPLFSTKITGIGLGLPIALRDARLNRGDLTVESEPGRGTTFRLILPAAGNRREAQPPHGSNG